MGRRSGKGTQNEVGVIGMGLISRKFKAREFKPYSQGISWETLVQALAT